MGYHSLFPGDLPDPGTEPRSAALKLNSLHLKHQEDIIKYIIYIYIYLINNIYLYIQRIYNIYLYKRASLVAQTITNLPIMQGETRVQSLGWKNPLEEDMATHSSTLAWRIPWTEEPDEL